MTTTTTTKTPTRTTRSFWPVESNRGQKGNAALCRSRRFDRYATERKRRRLLFLCKSANGRDDDNTTTTTTRSFFDDDDDFFREIGERLDRSFQHGHGRFFDQEEADFERRRRSAEARNNDNKTNAYDAFGPNKTIAKEIRKEHRGRHSYSNFHYTESVTTYGGGAAAAPSRERARSGGVVLDAPTLGCVVLLGMTYAYFKEKMVFSRNFSRTNFKEEEKEKLAREWPLLYASSETFRREFRKTKEEGTTTKTGSDAITNTNSESVNAERDDTTPDASTAR